MVPSTPTILRPCVQIPSTPSKFFSIWYWSKVRPKINEKEVGFGRYFLQRWQNRSMKGQQIESFCLSFFLSFFLSFWAVQNRQKISPKNKIFVFRPKTLQRISASKKRLWVTFIERANDGISRTKKMARTQDLRFGSSNEHWPLKIQHSCRSNNQSKRRIL